MVGEPPVTAGATREYHCAGWEGTATLVEDRELGDRRIPCVSEVPVKWSGYSIRLGRPGCPVCDYVHDLRGALCAEQAH